MYHFSMSHLAFVLLTLKMYAELELAADDRDKRERMKQIAFLLTQKRQFISRLYFHFVDDESAADFDQSRFVGTTNEHRGILFENKTLTAECVSRWTLHAKTTLDAQSLVIWQAHKAYLTI